jgi:hypothetical protein
MTDRFGSDFRRMRSTHTPPAAAGFRVFRRRGGGGPLPLEPPFRDRVLTAALTIGHLAAWRQRPAWPGASQCERAGPAGNQGHHVH